jgi:chemotaxis protein methyltransferase CheR
VATARIARCLRATGSRTFGEYIAHVEQDATGGELWTMVDALTVNQTQFFREPNHYPPYLGCLRELLLHHETVNVWSAGCATGEETFTLAMLAHVLIPGAAGRLRFLGTDISTSVLRSARAGLYDAARAHELPRIARSLLEDVGDITGRLRVARPVRDMVSFARHNLVGDWQMSGPMHVIFCRNVLLYFDRPTQRRVIAGFHDILAPGGYLFLGATETASTGTRFQYVLPSVYRRPR